MSFNELIQNKNQESKLGLYIISTPIGNQEDITIRALRLLAELDEVYCEDPRITLKLFKNYNIENKLNIYNDAAGERVRKDILTKITQGKKIGLVSDAGTPLISDPGYKLVRFLRENNIDIFSIPGSCASIAALTISGFPTDNFLFLGFPPRKKMALKNFVTENIDKSSTLIFYEAGNRVISFLETIENLPEIEIFIAKEITKLYENSFSGTATEILKTLADNDKLLKGEFVILLHKNQVPVTEFNSKYSLEETVKIGLKYFKIKDLSLFLSEISGINKKEIYNLGLERKEND